MRTRLINAWNTAVDFVNTMMLLALGMLIALLIMFAALRFTVSCSAPTVIDQWQRCAVRSLVVPVEIQVNFIPQQ